MYVAARMQACMYAWSMHVRLSVGMDGLIYALEIVPRG